jgi:hypothetical protein
VCSFARDHFAEASRRLLLIGGAGFDPRSLTVPRLLAEVAPGRVNAIFLRERRPVPSRTLRNAADSNVAALQSLLPGARIEDVHVLESDDAVGLGRNMAGLLNGVPLDDTTDVIVDFSALSIGASFPATRLFLEKVQRLERQASGSRRWNVHAVVTESPEIDRRIVPSPSRGVVSVHTFAGGYGLEATRRATKLWMPQLRFTHREALRLVYEDLKPDEVVPVVPFPSRDPRLGDRLVNDFLEEFTGPWDVDARSTVYAAEGHPLDFYRTVLRIHDGRQPVFEETGGSILVLTPVGSKVLAIGAMMAALERDLPVRYVEARGYSTEFAGDEPELSGTDDLVHVWLSGEAYPRYAA